MNFKSGFFFEVYNSIYLSSLLFTFPLRDACLLGLKLCAQTVELEAEGEGEEEDVVASGSSCVVHGVPVTHM